MTVTLHLKHFYTRRKRNLATWSKCVPHSLLKSTLFDM